MRERGRKKMCREKIYGWPSLPAATVIVQMRLLFTFAACYTLATCTRLYCCCCCCCWVWALWVHRNLSVFNHLYFHLSLVCVHSLTLARFFILTLYLSLSPSGLTMSSPIRIQGSWILEYRTSLTLIFHLFCSGKKLHFCLLAQWIEQRNNRIQKILSLSLYFSILNF